MMFRIEAVDLESVASADLRRLYGYWDERRAGREIPTRADIDPMDLRWIIGRVALVEVLPDGDFRWRVDGTQIAEFFRNDMTGRRLSEYPLPELREMMVAEYQAVVEARQPRLVKRTGLLDKRIWDYELLRLPLGTEGKVAMILSGLAIQNSRPVR